jgi:hypothetical protein
MTGAIEKTKDWPEPVRWLLHKWRVALALGFAVGPWYGLRPPRAGSYWQATIGFTVFWGALCIFVAWLARLIRKSEGRKKRQVRVRALVAILLAITVGYTGTFTSLYWNLKHDNFGGVAKAAKGQLSPRESVYFAVGTLGTAGTGSIYATTRDSRGIQLAEMVSGPLFILFAVGGVVARLMEDEDNDN